ncbi:MAG: class I SAM-dependent methyltransferase [Gammaproteobacteria bacterium]
MQTCERLKIGDFSSLAKNYAKYRPGYSTTVLHAILGIVHTPSSEIDFVDVGAGTGIWTRIVANEHCRSVIAVDPSEEMRNEGKKANGNLDISWREGTAENTHLLAQSANLVSMASSFHWTNFDLATKEFHRILKPNGHFVALWNPRFLEDSPLLLDIENYISHLQPNIKRVSSGKSKHVDELAKKMAECSLFKDLTYLEGKHSVTLSKEEYIGAWKSVNEIQARLGEIKFKQFLDYVADKLSMQDSIECSYQTRAWIMQKV